MNHFYNRANWDAGPWDDEPDFDRWVDEDTGYQCQIYRNSMGSLCGYVGVDRGHILHGVYYQEIEQDIRVHGGLTFSDYFDKEPRQGHNGEWWLGFDCGHFMDISPALGSFGSLYRMEGAAYRDIDYVRQECRLLAEQLQSIHRASMNPEEQVADREL